MTDRQDETAKKIADEVLRHECAEHESLYDGMVRVLSKHLAAHDAEKDREIEEYRAGMFEVLNGKNKPAMRHVAIRMLGGKKPPGIIARYKHLIAQLQKDKSGKGVLIKYSEHSRPIVYGKCYDCLMPYDNFPCDIVVPDDLWEQISPTERKGGGLLCPNCLLARIKTLNTDKANELLGRLILTERDREIERLRVDLSLIEARDAQQYRLRIAVEHERDQLRAELDALKAEHKHLGTLYSDKCVECTERNAELDAIKADRNVQYLCRTHRAGKVRDQMIEIGNIDPEKITIIETPTLATLIDKLAKGLVKKFTVRQRWGLSQTLYGNAHTEIIKAAMHKIAESEEE